MPRSRIFARFYTLRRGAVDHAQNASSLLRFGDDHLYRIRCCAEDVDDFGHIFDPAKDVDREPVRQNNDERMPCADGLRVANCQLLQFLIVAIDSGQTRAGRLVESDAELHLRRRVYDRFKQVLHRLDEVAGAKNEVPSLR